MTHSPQSEPGSYEVGYQKPPKQHQFKKGKSGNPNGRLKKVPAQDIPDDFQELIVKALMEKVSVKKNGEICELTKHEIFTQKLIDNAISGTPALALQTMKLLVTMNIPQKAAERWDQKMADRADQDIWIEEMGERLQTLAAEFMEEDEIEKTDSHIDKDEEPEIDSKKQE